MNTTDVKFGEWINRGWTLYKADWLPLLLAVVVMAVCVVVPMVVLIGPMAFHPVLAMIVNVIIMALVAGPLVVGLAGVVLRLAGGPEHKLEPGTAIGGMFRGYQQFKDASLLFLVVSGVSTLMEIVLGLVLPQFLAALFSLVLIVAALTAIMFAVWLLAESKCDFVTALKGSWAVVKTNFWPFLGFSVVAVVLSMVGAIACGVGIVATLPLYFCLFAVAYRDVFARSVATAATPPAL